MDLVSTLRAHAITYHGHVHSLPRVETSSVLFESAGGLMDMRRATHQIRHGVHIDAGLLHWQLLLLLWASFFQPERVHLPLSSIVSLGWPRSIW